MPTLTIKIIGSNNYFSLISLNINGLNSPIKRHRLTDWLNKQNPTFCLQETHLREKDRHYLRMKGWKTIFQANGLKKQTRVGILILNKIDLQPKILLLTGNTSQGKKQTLPQSERLENNFEVEETSWSSHSNIK